MSRKAGSRSAGQNSECRKYSNFLCNCIFWQTKIRLVGGFFSLYFLSFGITFAYFALRSVPSNRVRILVVNLTIPFTSV